MLFDKITHILVFKGMCVECVGGEVAWSAGQKGLEDPNMGSHQGTKYSQLMKMSH